MDGGLYARVAKKLRLNASYVSRVEYQATAISYRFTDYIDSIHWFFSLLRWRNEREAVLAYPSN